MGKRAGDGIIKFSEAQEDAAELRAQGKRVTIKRVSENNEFILKVSDRIPQMINNTKTIPKKMVLKSKKKTIKKKPKGFLSSKLLKGRLGGAKARRVVSDSQRQTAVNRVLAEIDRQKQNQILREKNIFFKG